MVPPHDWDSILLSSPPNSSSKWSKTGKNKNKTVKIRYNSKICHRNFIQNTPNFPSTCYGHFATFSLTSACVIYVLHAVQFGLHAVLKRSFTGIFYYFPFYWGPDRPGNMLSYPKSCCGSIATLPGSQFILLPINSCVQTIHDVPVVPFQYYSRHVAGNSSRKLETSFLHHLYVLIRIYSYCDSILMCTPPNSSSKLFKTVKSGKKSVITQISVVILSG